MITGSCLCGSVCYQISSAIGDIIHCHCETCRKAHGAAFSSVAAAPDECFSVTGTEHLSFYESSIGKRRYFCSQCGSQIYSKREGAKHIVLRLGTLDSDPEAQESKHIWVSQKAVWYTIGGQLPEHEHFE
jgi:hypothetical protein